MNKIGMIKRKIDSVMYSDENRLSKSISEKKENISEDNRKGIYRLRNIIMSDPENMVFSFFIIFMCLYYFWRMIAITPWYDELYTYYNFISKGPVFSAIHWPLPNNHVGYSVLSSILNFSGISCLGLRGVSYISAIANLILIYIICKKYFKQWLSFGIIIVYASFQLVNSLSVQGRGYTLATFCMLMSINAIIRLCMADSPEKRYYFVLAFFSFLGLYTVPSSVYWVIPLYLAAFTYLIVNGMRTKKTFGSIHNDNYFRRSFHIFWTGCVAAGVTIVMYSVIWLAIGSNLIVKDASSLYFGQGHVSTILHAPFKCIMTGMGYMLDTPYIQSVSSPEFFSRFPGWFIALLDQFVPGCGAVIFVICVCTICILLIKCISNFEQSTTCYRLIIIFLSLMMPVMLIFQHKLPYYRVFSYYGVMVALLICVFIKNLITSIFFFINKRSFCREKAEQTIKRRDIEGKIIYILTIVIIAAIQVVNPAFTGQIGTREHLALSALRMGNPTSRDVICATDCDQQYLLKYEWDIDCENTDITGADMVVIDRNMMKKGYDGGDLWRFYDTYDSIDWAYLDQMTIIYENSNFIVYVK